MRFTPQRSGLLLVLSLLLFPLGACGGGGGGGGGGGLPGVDNPPTLTIVSPTTGLAALPGDTVRITLIADDDGAATVTVFADADMNLATTGDQTTLFNGIDNNGAQITIPVVLPALATGSYMVVARIDDGTNPAVEVILPGSLLVYQAVAGIDPPRSNRYGVTAGYVIFSRGEAQDAAGALNGDGLADDGVMAAIDVATGLLVQPAPSVSMDVTGVAGGRVVPVATGGGALAWRTFEADENANLNAGNMFFPTLGGLPDADQADAMVSYVVPALSTTPRTNTYGGAGPIIDVVGGRALTSYAEAAEGAAGSDHNGDGDAADTHFGYVDTALPMAPFEFNQLALFAGNPLLPISSPLLRYRDISIGAYVGNEAGGPPATDLNGDGDSNDDLLFLVDFIAPGGAQGTLLAIAGQQAMPMLPPIPVDAGAAFDVSSAGYAAFYVNEGADNAAPGGIAGNDANGDFVIGTPCLGYDLNTQTRLIPAGVGGQVNSIPGNQNCVVDQTKGFFTAIEPAADPAPGTNGDGDGGSDLEVLYWMDMSTGPAPVATPLAVNFGGGLTLQALALDGGGSVTQLTDGWLSVVVNEASNGNQDINGSGAVDMALLLVDTSTAPAPTVHNPGIVPSAAGNIPLAGVFAPDPGNGVFGVLVRLREQQNGDLDSDGNATETLLAFINFATPNNVIVMDMGADQVAVANGYIAATAQESFTATDYDGNGSSTDFVFRVLDFSGNVVQPGLLCSTFSVPVTEAGNVFAYLRDEAVEARNLNGDGDQTDKILGIWVP